MRRTVVRLGILILVLATFLQPMAAHAAATITVTTTADSGPGSFRQALTTAVSGDTIAFDISGTGPHVIQPTSALPDLPGGVLIDGTTEPDYVSSPVVQIDGANAGIGVHGLTTDANDVVLDGLSVTGYSGNGLMIIGSSGMIIRNSYIGVTPSGSGAGNSFGIILHNTSNTQVGQAGNGNVISGHTFGAGINLSGTGASDTIKANVIGLTPDGQNGLANGEGIIVEKAGVTIGGAGAGDGNTIASNTAGGGGTTGEGVLLNAGASSTTITGNTIWFNDEGINVVADASPPYAFGNSLFGNGNGNLIDPDGIPGPQLDQVITHGNDVYVRGGMAGMLPSQAYDVSVATSSACGSESGPNHQTLAGTLQSVTDVNGDGLFAGLLTGDSAAGAIGTAQAAASTSTLIGQCVDAVPAAAKVLASGTTFGSGSPLINQNDAVMWKVTEGTHSVDDQTTLDLYATSIMGADEGFAYQYPVAGSYAYRCTVHPAMSGTVKVKLVGAKAGKKFEFTWAQDMAPNEMGYDVQVKTPTSRKFKTWQNDITNPSGIYTPKAGQGKYQFRARFVNTTTDGASGWSPTVTMKR